MSATGSRPGPRATSGGSATAPSRTSSHLRFAAVLLPALVLVLVVASFLLFTDPSSVAYECPGSTYTLLGEPAVGSAPEGFFDAVSACNEAARDRARAAVTVLLVGLTLVLVCASTSTLVASLERQRAGRR